MPFLSSNVHNAAATNEPILPNRKKYCYRDLVPSGKLIQAIQKVLDAYKKEHPRITFISRVVGRQEPVPPIFTMDEINFNVFFGDQFTYDNDDNFIVLSKDARESEQFNNVFYSERMGATDAFGYDACIQVILAWCICHLPAEQTDTILLDANLILDSEWLSLYQSVFGEMPDAQFEAVISHTPTSLHPPDARHVQYLPKYVEECRIRENLRVALISINTVSVNTLQVSVMLDCLKCVKELSIHELLSLTSCGYLDDKVEVPDANDDTLSNEEFEKRYEELQEHARRLMEIWSMFAIMSRSPNGVFALEGDIDTDDFHVSESNEGSPAVRINEVLDWLEEHYALDLLVQSSLKGVPLDDIIA